MNRTNYLTWSVLVEIDFEILMNGVTYNLESANFNNPTDSLLNRDQFAY